MIIIALLSTCLVHIQAGTFLSRSLSPQQKFCFHQDIPKHTLVTLNATSHGFSLKTQINYLRISIFSQTSRESVYKSFTTQNYGIFRVCFTSLEKTSFNIKFDFSFGAKARDYGNLHDNKDVLEGLENQARIANIFIDEIEKENKEGLAIMNAKQYLGKSNFWEYLFSCLFACLSIGLTYIQFRVIKNHLNAKKYL